MVTILIGDCIEQMKTLPDESVQCCVTSPPYWGLRRYLADDDPNKKHEIGLEPTPEAYVVKIVEVFREVRRVLRKDGTVFLNLGDCYAGSGRGYISKETNGIKPKDLVGIPWMVAFALRSDGWYLRSAIIWHKPNPMPESVTDRCTKAHEYIFLLTKSAKYYFDNIAIMEPAAYDGHKDARFKGSKKIDDRANAINTIAPARNKRDVWTINSQPFSGAHFATFPPSLVRPCILAGTSERGCCPDCGSPWERIVEQKHMVIKRSKRLHSLGQTRSSGTMLSPAESKTTGWRSTCTCNAGEPISCTVLDPFGGSGTVGEVAEVHGRNSILIELNPVYIKMAKKRTAQQGLFCSARGVEG